MISPVLHHILSHCSTSTIIMILVPACLRVYSNFTPQIHWQSSYKIGRDDLTEVLLSLPFSFVIREHSSDMLNTLDLTSRPSCRPGRPPPTFKLRRDNCEFKVLRATWSWNTNDAKIQVAYLKSSEACLSLPYPPESTTCKKEKSNWDSQPRPSRSLYQQSWCRHGHWGPVGVLVRNHVGVLVRNCEKTCEKTDFHMSGFEPGHVKISFFTCFFTVSY